MSRKQYPTYKPSGVPWLGEVPEGWEVKKLKTSVNYWVSNVDKVPSEDEQPILLCNYTDVYYNDFISPDLSLMETTATSEEIKKFHLEAGDVVITKDSESWEDIAVPSLIVKTESNLLCGYHLAMIRPKKNKIVGDYLFRQFQSNAINHQFQIASTGVTRYGLPKSAIGDAIIPLPPLPEQQAIAAFLDRETGRIDALIEKKKRLIALLKEKRSTMISRAVTKGLDPSVKMNPSGVPWLGDVPEGWEVKRTRFMLSMNPSKQEINHLSPETELAFLPMEAVGDNGTLQIDTFRPVSEVSSGYTFFAEGDVTYAKITPCFENGKGALMCRLGTGYGFGTTELTVLRPGSFLNAEYLYYLTFSRAFRKNGEAWMYGAGGQKRVPDEFVKEFRLGFPPLPEQQAIAAFLDRETSKIDALVSKVETAIERLKEYRTSLISSAVTGKIDVRDEV